MKKGDRHLALHGNDYARRCDSNLDPIRELCRYELPIGPDAMAAAKTYLFSPRYIANGLTGFFLFERLSR